MSQPVHVLLVRADGLLWALPVDNVDQTLELAGRSIHDVGGLPMVMFRDAALEVIDVAAVLSGAPPADRRSAVIVWAGGRRRAFAVDELVGQVWLEPVAVPAVADGPYVSGIVVTEGDRRAGTRAGRGGRRVGSGQRRGVRIHGDAAECAV